MTSLNDVILKTISWKYLVYIFTIVTIFSYLKEKDHATMCSYVSSHLQYDLCACAHSSP